MIERLVNIFARMAEWILGIIPLWVIVLVILGVIIWNSVKFKRLNFNECVAVDRAGNLVMKRGILLGYAVIITLLQFEKELRVINIGTEYSIPLYKDKEVWIDLRGGGRATLLSPKIWIRVEDGEKAVNVSYENGSFNFEEKIQSTAAREISGYLRTFDVDEIMNMAKKGKENPIFDQLRAQPFFEEMKDEMGVKLTGFTFKDLDFPPEVTAKRREEYSSRIGIKISENNAMAEAQKRSGSALPSVDSLLKANPGMSRDRAIEIWYDLQQRSTGTKITNEFDFGGSKNPLAEAAAVHGTVSNPQKKKKDEDKPSSFLDRGF